MQGCDHCRLLKGYTSFEKTFCQKLAPQWYEYKEKTDNADSVISRLPTLTANLLVYILVWQLKNVRDTQNNERPLPQ